MLGTPIDGNLHINPAGWGWLKSPFIVVMDDSGMLKKPPSRSSPMVSFQLGNASNLLSTGSTWVNKLPSQIGVKSPHRYGKKPGVKVEALRHPSQSLPVSSAMPGTNQGQHRMQQVGVRYNSSAMFRMMPQVGRRATSFPPTSTTKMSSSVRLSRMNLSSWSFCWQVAQGWVKRWNFKKCFPAMWSLFQKEHDDEANFGRFRS